MAEKTTPVSVAATLIFVASANPVLGAGLIAADVIGGRFAKSKREELKAKAKPLIPIFDGSKK